MEEAGKKERELALENGDVDPNGMPFITVLVDGGWSKRSYGHSYNAHSGVVSVHVRNNNNKKYKKITSEYYFTGIMFF